MFRAHKNDVENFDLTNTLLPFFSCQIYFHRTLEINLLVKIRKPVGRDSFLKLFYTTFPITYFSMASCLAACSLKYTSIKFLVYYKFLLGLIELLSILLKSGANHVNVTNRPRRTKFFRRHQTHTHITFFDSARLRLQSRAKGGGPLDTVPLDKVLFIQLVRKHDRS